MNILIPAVEIVGILAALLFIYAVVAWTLQSLYGRPLPPLIDGNCPVKERGPDGDRICIHPEGHDGDCDMRTVRP